MRKLLGWAVLIAVLVIGINYVSEHWPSGSRFGCAASGASVAQADPLNCPANLIDADGDAAWATARIAAINAKVADSSKKYTYGEFYDPDGTEHWYASGQDADADTARDVGRSAGVFPASGTVATVDHVEVKVAAQMRKANLTGGVLVINNPSGPCGQDTKGMYSCSVIVPKLLPATTTLVVWWPGPDPAQPEHQTFTGGA